jgi:hypothetical protein
VDATLTEQTNDMAKQNVVSVKLDAEVAKNAKTVADFMGISASKYMSDRLRNLVIEDLKRESEKFLKSQRKGPG